MSTLAIDSQLVKAYEENGMSPEQIAEDFGFDVVSVKAKLMQISTKYRKDCGAESPEENVLNFSKDEQESVKRMLLQIALGAENEAIRLKACLNIRDDAMGRKDVKQVMAGSTFNILNINDAIVAAREQASRVVGSVPKKKEREAIEA